MQPILEALINKRFDDLQKTPELTIKWEDMCINGPVVKNVKAIVSRYSLDEMEDLSDRKIPVVSALAAFEKRKRIQEKKSEASVNDLGIAATPALGGVKNPLSKMAGYEDRMKDRMKELQKAKQKKNEELSEGGPGSGKKFDNTMPIGMELGKVTIGKRKQFMAGKHSTKKDIDLSRISSVAQKKYVPEKLSKMLAVWDKVKDKPIQVLSDRKGNLQVLDGHHRFLAAKAKGEKRISAQVYMSEGFIVEEKVQPSLQGKWKHVTGSKPHQGKDGVFKVGELGMLFWLPSAKNLDPIFLDFIEPKDVKPKSDKVEVKVSGRSFVFER